MTLTLENSVSLEPAFGPQGQTIYDRTYSRVKSDGSPENWLDTVIRVVDGNLGLVGNKFHEVDEREKLVDLFYNFKALPAGRHLWMSGVPGRQFLFNCHVSGFAENISEHYSFTFNQLMQGGGVGANYSNEFVLKYGPVVHDLELHLVCDSQHPDHDDISQYLSKEYSADWHGAIRVEDSREGWISVLQELLEAHYDSASTDVEPKLVLDVSLIRCSGSRIKTFGGTAAGPAPLARMLMEVNDLLRARHAQVLTSLDHMKIDHYIANCVVSGNVRRSARMSIKNWADSDIFDFIHCKQGFIDHWSTNISVEIDDDFFRALGKKEQHAIGVYNTVVENMLENGEPGFYNRSLAQEGEVGEVVSTNPCGEIALEAWENCCLGHINLDAFVGDFPGAAEAHRLMTRFLIRASFGDISAPQQRAVVDRNRRIGVGHFGFQGWLVKQGIRFSDSHRNGYVRKTLKDFYDLVRKEARRYAFQLRIPEPIKVTTVAPTGTIAKLPGRTEGLHPVYAKYFKRRVRFSTVDPGQATQLDKFRDQGLSVVDCLYTPNTKVVEFITKESLVAEVEDLGLDADYLVEAANEIGLSDMLAVQAMYQECYADNALSFTVNIEPDKYTVDQARDTLIHYLPKLKGTTIMMDNSRPQAPYERITRDEWESHTGHKEVTDSVDEACATGACPIR